MAIQAVASYDSQVLDYTIDPVGSSSTGVPTNFTITGTLPVRINGGASADLSTSPLTVSTNQFGAAAAGIVPLSGGGTTNFLRADGTWVAPSGTGLNYQTIQEEGVDLTQRAKLNFISTDATAADDAVNAVTKVTLNRFSSITGGTVSASGGGTTNFLRADGSWASPSAGIVGVRLQVTSPGTVDVGHAYISGTFIADSHVMVGFTGTALSANRAKIEAYTENSDGAYFGRVAGIAGSAALSFQRSRGALSLPTATQDTDTLGSITASGFSTTGTWSGNLSAGMFVRADGNALATRQPSLTDVIGGDVSNFSLLRTTGAGLRIESGLSTITSSVRAKSTLDVLGSLSLRTELFSGATIFYTVGGTSCLHLIDCSAAIKIFTLPTAASITGRIYGFTKTDTSANAVTVNCTGGERINGVDSAILGVPGETVVLVSDGTNWWTIQDSRKPERSSISTDSSAYASSTAETSVGLVLNDVPVRPGMAIWQYFTGKFSTTGTPTLRFRMTSPSGGFMCDSTALTMPNNAANYPWMVEVRSVVRTVAAAIGTGRVVRAILHIGSSTGAMTAYSMLSSFGDLAVALTGSAQLYLTWGTSSASNTATLTAAEGGAVEATTIL